MIPNFCWVQYEGDRASTHCNRDQDLRKSGLELYNGREAAATALQVFSAELKTFLSCYFVTEELCYHYEA